MFFWPPDAPSGSMFIDPVYPMQPEFDGRMGSEDAA